MDATGIAIVIVWLVAFGFVFWRFRGPPRGSTHKQPIGPGGGGFVCGACGFCATTSEEMRDHTYCTGRRPNPHWRTDGGP